MCERVALAGRPVDIQYLYCRLQDIEGASGHPFLAPPFLPSLLPVFLTPTQANYSRSQKGALEAD